AGGPAAGRAGEVKALAARPRRGDTHRSGAGAAHRDGSPPANARGEPMPLFRCPDFSGRVSGEDLTCPHCGRALDSIEELPPLDEGFAAPAPGLVPGKPSWNSLGNLLLPVSAAFLPPGPPPESFVAVACVSNADYAAFVREGGPEPRA